MQHCATSILHNINSRCSSGNVMNNGSGRAQQRQRTCTTAVATVTVDRHSCEVDAYSSDGGSCGGCTTVAVDAYSSEVDAHNSDSSLRWTHTTMRWTRTSATAATAVDAHNSDDDNCGGRAQQRRWTCRTMVPMGATRRG